MMRPKSNHRDLPPRMLRRVRTLKSGKVWESFYYNGRDAEGRRVEITEKVYRRVGETVKPTK